ncbi:MAG: aminotransferase class III-fold pyridoxal phosphate-dependent enzyme [Acetobacteraceae bacterium]|nr:aminotransferase class III-fold pyridoxal phosphate-dependent enzyme [Acetobacteraceae bacterium]MSP29986.1 aminotransferase class III-fold pyridoxal phosphate-dependent enzyme [Acetobacteraceae bacterium]
MDTIQDTRSNSSIEAAYRAHTPGSAKLAAEAGTLFPSGITHDARNIDPYGIYIERAQGPRKWDVDGHGYVDYFGGHGALILGHRDPAVSRAVTEAYDAGSHFGANHPREVAWGRAVQRLVPSAERVRFTSSGTEATLMAVRLARAFTGRQTVLRFKGHFHGWHDHMTHGYTNHFDGTPTTGVVAGVADKNIVVAPGDMAAVRAAFAANKDIAAIILEPTGASFGQVPVTPDFVHFLREITTQNDSLLIMDEVVTGFRVSRGGAATEFGITPDLSSFAKIIAGGLPGAAIAGRKDILDLLDFAVTKKSGKEKVQHPGTFNANPVSAAAGIAVLTQLAETDACDKAIAIAGRLRNALNEMLAAENVPWAIYGTFSGFHLFLNAKGHKIDHENFDPLAIDPDEFKAHPPVLSNKLRLALLVNGVDISGRLGGFTSATHNTVEINDTVDAFREATRMLRFEGELPG